jgi:dipeptidase D
MSIIDNLEPKLVWNHFNKIRRIPRCSKHEEKIREYIINFTKNNNLSYKTDNIGNIVISKTGTIGFENKPTIILQGHMDMVCEKNSDVDFDFSNDPIQLKMKKENILTAVGTTLGADNGIGVAIILAILENKNVEHCPLEALFTVDEETGLTGAFKLDNKMLIGRILINLDSEDFGVITVGCAGGGDTKIELPIVKKSIEKHLVSIRLKISGLKGGHSGVDIHEQRGNAIKIISRMLWKTSNDYKFNISDIKGGDKHNAIPREAFVNIIIDNSIKKNFIDALKNEYKNILNEISSIDPKLKMDVFDIDDIKLVLNQESQFRLLNLLYSLPHGVDKMSYEMPNLVETSTNLATISVGQKNAIISLSTRSSIKSSLQDLRDRIHSIANLSGAKIQEEEPYPGWKPNLESKILQFSKKIFKDIYNKDANIEAIHAGLECGIIGEKFPGMDMISIGPTIKYPHSPDEELHINTVEKTYKYVLRIIKEIE